MVGAIVRSYKETPNPVETTTEEIPNIVGTDEDKNIEIEVKEKSYLEEVYNNPFFEDPSDMWLSSYREEAEIDDVLLKRKQNSKLKLKKKQKRK